MAVAKSVKWSQDQEILLIELVKERQFLWDIRHEYYPLRNLKRTSYEEIANNLCAKYPASAGLFTVDEVMNKFSNLRTYYRKENKKFKMPSGSAGIGFVPRWEHFFRMQFLDETMEPSSSTSNLDTSITSEVDKENSSIQENAYDTETLTQLEDAPEVMKNNRKRKRKNETDLTDFAIKALGEIQAKVEDEEEIYGQYIAKVLKSFDPLKRDLCKLEFERVIIRLRHEYDVE